MAPGTDARPRRAFPGRRAAAKGTRVPGIRTGGRWATVGLAVVVVLLTGVTIVAVAGSRRAVESVSKSTLLADAYLRANAAVTAEESLERKYRLEPAPEVRSRFDAAADGLRAGLEDVRHRGGTSDRVLVDRVEVEHVGYVTATDRLFDA